METARTMWGKIIGDRSTPVSARRKRVRQRWGAGAQNERGTTTNRGRIKKRPTSTLPAVSATRRAGGRRRRLSRLTARSEDAVESHDTVGDEEYNQRDEEQD